MAATRRQRTGNEYEPVVYIIAGPNGSGKTTFARQFLPRYVKCLEFVNADYLAEGLSPLAPNRAAIQAGRLMLARINSLVSGKRSFGFETTLAGKSYVNLIQKLKALGYGVHLYFLWLPRVSIALQRIAQRVRKGGHDIPVEVVKRRFKAGIGNLFNVYGPIVDSWTIWDAATHPPRKIVMRRAANLRVYQKILYNQLKPKTQKR